MRLHPLLPGELHPQGRLFAEQVHHPGEVVCPDPENVLLAHTLDKKAETFLENGGTVVIGGVYAQTNTFGESKVPFLGDIPGLGYLFRSTSKVNNKSELLVFISPKIIKDAMSLR